MRGQLVRFPYELENAGPAAAPSGFKNALYVDGRRVVSTLGPSLGAGASAEGVLAWRATCGVHTVEVRTDDDRQVPESREDNNVAVKTVQVTCTPSGHRE